MSAVICREKINLTIGRVAVGLAFFNVLNCRDAFQQLTFRKSVKSGKGLAASLAKIFIYRRAGIICLCLYWYGRHFKGFLPSQ